MRLFSINNIIIKNNYNVHRTNNQLDNVYIFNTTYIKLPIDLNK